MNAQQINKQGVPQRRALHDEILSASIRSGPMIDIEAKAEGACENQEEIIESTECENSCVGEDRLPILNKRAHSVDQNYKLL